jgi:DNA repair protein RadC
MPSQEDDRLTTKIIEAAKLVDLRLLDHIIIAQKSFYSFAEEGKI